MPDEEYIRIPLRRRDGAIRAHALLDATDAHLAELRWCLNGQGYVIRNIKVDGRCKAVMLHREVLGLQRGDPMEGDHINRNALDNRRSNLRIVTHAENQHNKGSCGGSSQYRGVTWDRINLKWIAQCKLAGRCNFLGHYADEAEAAAVAAAFRLQHMSHATD